MAVGLTAVLLGAAAACTPPPEPPPACPARQQVVLEPTDPVAFSLARAVSPNGAHMVLSRVLGSDLVLSLRTVQPGSPSTVVGSLPTAPTDRRVLVGVDDAGSRVVFGREGRAATPADPPSVLHRWSASTGTVTDVITKNSKKRWPTEAMFLALFGDRISGSMLLALSTIMLRTLPTAATRGQPRQPTTGRPSGSPVRRPHPWRPSSSRRRPRRRTSCPTTPPA